MDIPALSMAMAQVQLQTDVGTAILAKSLDMSDTMGDSMAAMLDSAAMEHSVTPHLGSSIDITV